MGMYETLFDWINNRLIRTMARSNSLRSKVLANRVGLMKSRPGCQERFSDPCHVHIFAFLGHANLMHWSSDLQSRAINQMGVRLLFPSQEWSIPNFFRSLTRNITSQGKRNLASHSLLRWRMIILPILTTSLIHFSFKRLGGCIFSNLECKGQTPSTSRLLSK